MELKMDERLQTLELAKEVRDLRQLVMQMQSQVGSLANNDKKRKVDEREPCKALTGKGTPCKHYTIAGTDFCTTHNKEPKSKQSKPKRIKTEPKPKKRQGEHSKDPNLRETHGDVFDEGLPSEEFVMVTDLSEVLTEYNGFCTLGLDPQAFEEKLLARRMEIRKEVTN